MDDVPLSLHELGSVRPELRWAYHGDVPASGTMYHTPDRYTCWFIEQGWSEVRCDDGRHYRASEGEWLCSPPYVPRYQAFPTKSVILSVGFALTMPAQAQIDAGLPVVIRDALTIANLRQPGLDLVRHLHGSADPIPHRRQRHQLTLAEWFAAQQSLAAFVAAWFSAVVTPAAPMQSQDHRVTNACTILSTNPRMGNVPYADLEIHTGLSQVHLDRLFRQHLGYSPKAELDRLCFERVLRRLADPQHQLKAIASDLGFTDTSHLCRWFRRRCGQSPQHYRTTAVV